MVELNNKIIDKFENYSVDTLGNIKNLKTGKILRPTENSGGYLYVTFSKNGRNHKKKVHRLVAEAFIPNPENKPHIDHINNMRTDNRIENLRWCTRSENMQHAFRQGRMKGVFTKGYSHPLCKLNYDHLWTIKQLLLGGVFSQREIAVLFNVHRSTISGIKTGRQWSHI